MSRDRDAVRLAELEGLPYTLALRRVREQRAATAAALDAAEKLDLADRRARGVTTPTPVGPTDLIFQEPQ